MPAPKTEGRSFVADGGKTVCRQKQEPQGVAVAALQFFSLSYDARPSICRVHLLIAELIPNLLSDRNAANARHVCGPIDFSWLPVWFCCL